jgi:hypothetical protein
VRNEVALLAGVAIGVGAMFLLVPDRGRRSRFADSVPDARKLRDRVRAELGRVVSHPHAIDVSVLHDGCVSLSGPILSSEADTALAAVAGARGVQTVEDNLERHESPEGIPALQGARLWTGRRMGVVRSSWSRVTKLMVALTGTAVVAGVTYARRGSTTSGEAAA